MNFLMLLLVVFISTPVYAARIISDPYAATVLQPDSCGYIEGTAVAVMSPVESVSGGVRCSISLAGVSNGPHTYKIFARSNVWGDSTQINFTFVAGAPSTPGGLQIIQ